MTLRASILVVEDEPAIRRGLCDLLAFHGHAPTPAVDGAEGRRLMLDQAWDLVILDVMLPHVDGITLCRELRAARSGQAILMLTAKGAEADILAGFEAGCDDYISKPFSLPQLVARVTALLRRVSAAGQRLQIGPVEVDTAALVARGDGEVELSTRDVEVLGHLARHRERVVPRKELLSEVWGFARVDRVETRAVDMHIAKLRKKLAEVTEVDVIETVRGAGYRLSREL
ncbi:MAG: response regulator transcription factor [Deltaproteobacteria bacterium]|nr:MAG: response regulator transcription factor [Deltaproteobacteria bacterium]